MLRPSTLLILGAVVVTVIGGGNTVARATPESPSFVPGSASASGTVAGVRLFYGGLSLPLGVGTAATSYTNTQSRALGAAMDLGAYMSLVTDTPPQFSPMVIDSNAGDREEHGDIGAGEAIGSVELWATQAPASSADVWMSDVSLPSLVQVEGAHSRSSTEVRDGRQRRAAASVEMSSISIAGGLVVLEDVRWAAEQRSGFEPAADAGFVVGRARVAGIAVPIPAGDISGMLGAINAVLDPVGLRIEAPTSTRPSDGAVAISPLRVVFADSELGAQVLGPIVASGRPLLAPALDATTDVNSSLGLVGLVADLVLGVADGSGGIEVTVGGATATTSEVGYVAPTIPPPPVEPAEAPVASGDVSPPSADTTDEPTVQPVPPTRDDAAVAAPSPRPVTTSTSLRCALEAAPLRSGDCRASNIPVAIAISLVAITGVASAELGVRRRKTQAAELT